MVLFHLAGVLLLALGSPGVPVAGSEWMEEPYGDDSFNSRVMFNHNVTLVCNDSSPDGAGYVFRYWIAPDLTVMNESYWREFWTFDGWAGWRVSDDGAELHAYLVQEAHFGFYYCVKERSPGEVHVVKKAINYEGPYWGNLWEKYETNTIVGLGASGGFLALCFMIGITIHFRYHDDNDDDVRKQNGGFHGIEEYQNEGYTSAGFEPIKGVGFTPVSPVDVHLVTGKPYGSGSKMSTEL